MISHKLKVNSRQWTQSNLYDLLGHLVDCFSPVPLVVRPVNLHQAMNELPKFAASLKMVLRSKFWKHFMWP